MGGCGGSAARPGIAGPGPPQLRASESKGGFLPSEEEGPSACFLLRSKIDALGLPVFHYFQSLVIKSEFINLLVLLKVNYTNLKKKKNKQDQSLLPVSCGRMSRWSPDPGERQGGGGSPAPPQGRPALPGWPMTCQLFHSEAHFPEA